MCSTHCGGFCLSLTNAEVWGPIFSSTLAEPMIVSPGKFFQHWTSHFPSSSGSRDGADKHTYRAHSIGISGGQTVANYQLAPNGTHFNGSRLLRRQPKSARLESSGV